jgi:protoporphyrin/coproporphyrin ferrochelatase
MNKNTAILLVNLGSPDSPSEHDVKKYLEEFLMDEYVIDIPKPLRWLLIKGIVLQTRPKKSAAAYQSIWTENGSPLIHISKLFFEKFKNKVHQPVALAMRYGNPSLETVIEKFLNENKLLDELMLVPLYPHYAMASTKTVEEKTKEILQKNYPQIKLNILQPFYNHPLYINSLCATIKKHSSAETDYTLFSYHGIPERHVKKTDVTGAHCFKVENCCNVKSEAHACCYRHQVFETTRLVARQLQLPLSKFSISFQSRLGKDAWLQPFTEPELQRLAKNGVKRLRVVCPAFVTDCLETIEEMGERGKKVFLDAGGKEFHLVPCMNDDDIWVNALHEICLQEIENNF